MLIKPSSDSSSPVDAGHLGTDHSHQDRHVSKGKRWSLRVWILNWLAVTPQSQETSGSKSCQRNLSPKHDRTTGPPHRGDQAFTPAPFSWCSPHLHITHLPRIWRRMTHVTDHNTNSHTSIDWHLGFLHLWSVTFVQWVTLPSCQLCPKFKSSGPFYACQRAW